MWWSCIEKSIKNWTFSWRAEIMCSHWQGTPSHTHKPQLGFHYTTAESQLLQMWPTKPGIVCLLKRGTSKTRSSAQKCWKWPCVVLGKQVLLDFLELTIRKQFLKACCLWSTQTFISVSAQKFQLCILWCVKFENIRKPYPKPLALKKKKVLLVNANFSNQLNCRQNIQHTHN